MDGDGAALGGVIRRMGCMINFLNDSDFLIRSHLELALFMVSDQYTGHKTTGPHLVYTGDRMNFAYSRR